jgi:hypothetical protein
MDQPELYLFPLNDLKTKGYAKPEPHTDETVTAVDDTGEEEAA